MIVVQIEGSRPAVLDELRGVIGGRLTYRRGTDIGLYVDFVHRAEADLAVRNLNLITGVKARIEEPCPSAHSSNL